MSNRERIRHLLWSWLSVGFIYGTTRYMPGEHWIIPELWLDRQIPFNSAGVWLYLAFFIFVPWAFFKAEAARIYPLRYAIQISALISGIIFILFPSSLSYPTVMTEDIHTSAFKFLLAIDTTQNCLPSLHAALIFLGLLALWDWQKKWQSALYLLVTLAMAFSIIQLRRHLTLDVSAGVVVGIIAYFAAKKLIAQYPSLLRQSL